MKMVCIENTHNAPGGATLPPLEKVLESAGAAHGLGASVHLDGARLWNAAVAAVPAAGNRRFRLRVT